ncbi:MAG TPA: DUF192 domain-containing protein [Candidatus Eisenbacteria bacterium]|nr:DUF192 domain-containing protein [Candidatus Eisenbacteria bacterium]
MKKIFFPLLAICILVNLFIIYNIFHTTPLAIINSHDFYLDVALTPQQKEIGLAKYTSLPDNKAMYFPFDRADYYSFWMKGMHFPIDIIFLKDKKIVTIYSSVPIPTQQQTNNLPMYKPKGPANSVLEINAGLSEKYGFKEGDMVEIYN